MKLDVRVTTTQSRKESVDVDVEAVLDSILAYFLMHPQAEKYNIPSGAYINAAGNWETWEKTHGSGDTVVWRKATDAEVEVYNAYRVLWNHERKLKTAASHQGLSGRVVSPT